MAESDIASVSDVVAAAVVQGAPRPDVANVVLEWGGEIGPSVHEVDSAAVTSSDNPGFYLWIPW
jgi:hypothetical protein